MLAPVCHSEIPRATDSVGWRAFLKLDFARRADFTDLRFRHEGPLRIQKPLYPEGNQCCHAVVVHPPGGIAGGDCLEMDISIGSQTHAVITTPSAAKWYGSFDGRQAIQEIDISVDGNLEWLPSETIVFDKACVESKITVRASHNARMLGWDLLIFGRHGCGEKFTAGLFEQTLKLDLEDDTVWIDRLRLAGSDALFDSPIGLGGYNTLATCWALAPSSEPWSETSIAAIRTETPEIAWTCLHPQLMVGRQIGCPIQLQKQLRQAWRFIKETCWGLPAPDVRLWAT